jgi:NAD-dependent deacetylase
MKKKLVILTGAGISAESGISTFRDSNGLWENHKVEDVASPDGWKANPELVIEFYNQRRRQLATVEPNDGHKLLVKLEGKYDVYVITQNVDDLHERAGSSKILHLHGMLTSSKSSGNDKTVKDIGYDDIKIGDLCEEGFQMRPNIVWFGETVPYINTAEGLAYDADIFVIIGTSLVVYPAAGLIRHVHAPAPVYIIDPNDVPTKGIGWMRRKDCTTFIKKSATEGVAELVEILLKD